MNTLTASQLAKRLQLTRPANGMTSQGFGENRISLYRELGLSGHNGIDIANSAGTPIFFPCDATILRIAPDDRGSSYGIHIWIAPEDIIFQEGSWQGTVRLEMVLAHFSAVEEGLQVGTKVTRGQKAGKMGCTGACTGPHVHFEIKPLYRIVSGISEAWVADTSNGYGGRIDPEPFFETYPLDLDRIYSSFDGRLIKSTDSPRVYLLQNGKRHWFPSEEALWSYGYKLWGVGPEEIIKLAPFELNAIPIGENLVRGPHWDFLQGILSELTNYVKQT